MVISGLDPSFTSTGVAVIDTDNKTIKTTAICVGCKDKSFLGIQHSIEEIIKTLETILCDTNALVMEYPFAGRIFSAGLYGLDSVIYFHFKNKIIQTFHPTVLRKIHGMKYTKKDSISLATKVISALEEEGYVFLNMDNKSNITTKKENKSKQYKLSSDESEALLYTVVSCLKTNNLICNENINNIVNVEKINWINNEC